MARRVYTKSRDGKDRTTIVVALRYTEDEIVRLQQMAVKIGKYRKEPTTVEDIVGQAASVGTSAWEIEESFDYILDSDE